MPVCVQRTGRPDLIRHPEPIVFTGFRCLPLALALGLARPAQGQARTLIRGSPE
jgi:hypothetical protein